MTLSGEKQPYSRGGGDKAGFRRLVKLMCLIYHLYKIFTRHVHAH